MTKNMTSIEKKPKPLRPFRVRPSSIVAVRYRPPSTSTLTSTSTSTPSTKTKSSSKFIEMWLDPIPGRDMNYNLIGKVIRCIFPKKYHPDLIPNERTLQGEIISTVNVNNDNDDNNDNVKNYQNNEFEVKLLIDKEYVSKMPFLKVEEEDSDDEKSNISKKERKRRLYEEIIRGKDKVIITLSLSNIVQFTSTSTSASASTIENHLDKEDKPSKPVKWVIRKWVPMKTGGKKALQYVGDGHDDTLQQEKNFRWLSTMQQYNFDNTHNHDHGQVSTSTNANTNTNTQSHYHYQIGEVETVELNHEKIKNQKSKSSLATVTVKRMILPELTRKGRSDCHGFNEIFDLYHGDDKQRKQQQLLGLSPTFQVPIEDLIVFSNKVQRMNTNTNMNTNNDHCSSSNNLFVRYKYNLTKNIFHQYHDPHIVPDKDSLNKISELSVMSRMFGLEVGDKSEKSDECGFQNEKKMKFPQKPSLLAFTKALLDTASPCDFDLPFDFLKNYPPPKSDPYDLSAPPPKRQKKLSNKKSTGRSSPKVATKTKTKKVAKKEETLIQTAPMKNDEEEFKVFKPTSARCISSDTIVRSGVRQTNNSAAHAARSVASIRSGGRKLDRSKGSISSNQDKKSSGRAARASHRRRNKAIGILGLEQQTNMVGREDVLRFGKSLIHGWGVFTDGNIVAGDLIVEYRGVLIGNIIADRREKEYERAKIGSDYMFRIDSETVCDATRQGNVARFINASCTPNCYTQIITRNGSKRIVIYAKKDIAPGEELSYDYKFEPEFAESKRIPCNCGTVDCRGFMNWNKKYVAINNSNQLAIEQANLKGKGRG